MKRATWSLGALLFASLVLAGCKDEGVAQYQKARAHYDKLIDQGRPISDPEFQQVRRELEAVPPGSDAHDDAAKLAALIPNEKLPPRPLAFVPTADAGAVDVRCAELAAKLGRADAGRRAAVMEELRKCRQALEREHAHSNESDGDAPN
ncbi:MAG: hypothetical protein IRZ16_06000 [Myxococcaceae bacterium]|nr:hypothetical protein [Myxococcaceae bacterium]